MSAEFAAFSADFLHWCVRFSLGGLTLALIFAVYRVVAGPTTPDRVLGLDTIVSVAIGYIAVLGISTGDYLYIDVAVALGLVGFLATVAFARFVLQRGPFEAADDNTPKSDWEIEP